KGSTLYAIALGWPEDGQLVVHSLARPAGQDINQITAVSLLGHPGKVEWKQMDEALIVTLPSRRVSEFTAALKITGTALTNIPFTVTAPALAPDSQGNYKLAPEDADLHGEQIGTEERDGQSNIAFWDRSGDWVSWKTSFPQAGRFKVSAN